jgi:hypothetical protein
MSERTIGLPEAVEVDFKANGAELAPKKCLICHQFYDIVYEKNGRIIYRHNGMKRDHEYSEPVLSLY